MGNKLWREKQPWKMVLAAPLAVHIQGPVLLKHHMSAACTASLKVSALTLACVICGR